MYYRILVNLNGEKLFRTSRLHSTGDMVSALSLFSATMAPITTSVLAVDDEGEGSVLTHEELHGVVTTYNNSPESWKPAPTTSTAEIQAALNGEPMASSHADQTADEKAVALLRDHGCDESVFPLITIARQIGSFYGCA